MQDKTIVVAKVLKSQGIKGALKIQTYSDVPNRFKLLSTVFIDEKPHELESVFNSGGFVVLKIKGINDRESAEKFREKLISIDKNDVAMPKEGYFIMDLVGSSVLDDSGNNLGAIHDINGFGTADVIECGKFRFPHLQHIVKSIDIEKKEFIVYRKFFDEVVVYDD